jgi:hypothetical protein
MATPGRNYELKKNHSYLLNRRLHLRNLKFIEHKKIEIFCRVLDSAPGKGVSLFDSALYTCTDRTTFYASTPNSHVQLGDLSWENCTDVSWIFIAHALAVRIIR